MWVVMADERHVERRTKVLYLVIKNPLKNRSNITGKTVGWKKVLNTLVMYYGDRVTVQ
ncbi:hypothetical protein MOQ72_31190 [Saccharopolyspora sp. K220]|uniref:hypothetical protein n=1 Tax=Saccharopolyspora soli TaxID=2926618 RepID=UPI001F56E401|nr:hypothetical protein [Saccharopolyspora soli]MCI2421910.1 hypothetical protein [Saccharopolyspora soli]